MEWNKVMMTRQSCREYTEEQITESQLKAVLQAGCAAPVARGKFEQLQITVVQKPELLKTIDAVVAKAFGDDSFSCTRGAPTVILVSVQEQEGQISPMMMASAACVVENMHLAATDLGLGSVYLGSIQQVCNSLEVLYNLKLQDGFWPVLALSVGNARQPMEARPVPMTKIFTNFVE